MFNFLLDMSGGAATGIIALIALFVIAVVILIANIKIVPQARALVVERLGSYKATWFTGLHLKVPFIETIAKDIFKKANGSLAFFKLLIINKYHCFVCLTLECKNLSPLTSSGFAAQRSLTY